MTDRIGIDAQIADQDLFVTKLQRSGCKQRVLEMEVAKLATLRDYKRIMEAKVPDAIPEMSVTHPDYDSHHDAYRSGWNACRNAMIRAAQEE
jgi:hypothetical protein